MPTETDLRLTSWLDANQSDPEHMSRAILALDPHDTEVRHCHPSTGPDGGRDIEAMFDAMRPTYGAVDFANGANDSSEQRSAIRRKITSDLASAITANPSHKVFALLSNAHSTVGEQNAMKQEAKISG